MGYAPCTVPASTCQFCAVPLHVSVTTLPETEARRLDWAAASDATAQAAVRARTATRERNMPVPRGRRDHAAPPAQRVSTGAAHCAGSGVQSWSGRTSVRPGWSGRTSVRPSPGTVQLKLDRSIRRRIRQRLQIVRVRERQRLGVYAVPLPGRPRAVGEDVPQVAVAARAEDLHSAHAVAVVRALGDVLLGDRLEERRPPGAGVELVARGEERQ